MGREEDVTPAIARRMLRTLRTIVVNRYPMHPEAEQLLLKVERQRKRRLRSLDATRAALRKLGRGAL